MSSWMYAPPSRAPATTGDAASNAPSAQSASQDPGSSPIQGRTSPSAPRIRRRNRLITSCLECRRRKLKCDKTAPCANCVRFKRDCLYLAPSMDPSSRQKLTDLKEKMGALEKNLEREVASSVQKAHQSRASVTGVSSDDFKAEDDDAVDDDGGGDGDEDEDVRPGSNDIEDTLEPTPYASLDNIYEDSGDDELMDLGVQMGKMRISERIGGWIRPKLADELSNTLEDPFRDASWRPKQAQRLPRLQASPKSYIGPGPDYIAPANGFFFPGTNMNTTLMDYLPSKSASDQLVSQYWSAVHFMCRLVHRPTFDAQYTLFWHQIATGTQPAAPVQALMFAAMLSAAVSMTNDQITQSFDTSKDALIDILRSGTEMALAKANFLRTTKLDTMQAFVMYLIPLVRAEVSRAHSALVGTAIRLAECMGLHRDGSSYQMTPVAVQVRRMIWHQLCFLDMRTCEATGPWPQIRKDDYDTKLPFVLNDVDLMAPTLPPEEMATWTDATFLRMRCECVEMRRQTWFDVLQIDKKKKPLTTVLVKIQNFVASMQAKYYPLLDPKIPFQAFTRLLLEHSLQCLHIQVLHRYLFVLPKRMPDRLRQVLIEASLTSIENSIAFETNPNLQTWVWYRGAFNQYHPALLLLIEVYLYPMRKEAPRIWRCLDYIFEIPPHLAPKQKAELVLTDLRDRMGMYHQLRKIKTSNRMEQQVHGFEVAAANPPIRTVAESLPPVVDATGHMLQQPLRPTPSDSSFTGALTPQAATESNSGSSRQDSIPTDASMGTMDDIDWAEWDKVFHPEVNTGELNIPDFNMATFTGDWDAAAPKDSAQYPEPMAPGYGFSGPNAASLDFTTSNLAVNMPLGDSLTDVNFAAQTLLAPRSGPWEPPQGQTWRNYQ